MEIHKILQMVAYVLLVVTLLHLSVYVINDYYGGTSASIFSRNTSISCNERCEDICEHNQSCEKECLFEQCGSGNKPLLK